MFSDLNALVTWFEFQSPSKTTMTFYDYFKKQKEKENKKYPDK